MFAAAAITVVSGLVQYYQAEKARGESKAKLDSIEKKFNELTPPGYDLSIMDPPALHQETLQSPKFSAELQSPQFISTAFTPENLKSVGDMIPHLAPIIKEIAPTVIKVSDDMKKGRQAQLTALDKLTKVGEGGFDPEYQQKVQQAQQAAQSQARAQQQTLADTYNRRGIGGSGLELAQAMQGNASAMNSAAQSNQQAATDAYRNQLAALSQGAALGGDIYSQDQSLQGQNAAIINAFNQRTSAAQQMWEQQNADTMNQAQAQNLQNQQRIADTNVGNRNQAALADRNRLDDLTKYGYQNQLGQQQRQDNIAIQQYQNQLGERNYQNSVAQSLADWQRQQRDYQNDMKQTIFANKMGILGGQTGLANTQSNATLQTAADKNKAIAGVSDAALKYGTSSK